MSDGPTIAQVELADETTDDSLPATPPTLLHGESLARVIAGRRLRRTTTIAGLRGEVAVGRGAGAGSRPQAALVIGRSVAAREETLHRLAREFLFAAPRPAARIFAGYALAAAALRPVEAMRRRAA